MTWPTKRQRQWQKHLEKTKTKTKISMMTILWPHPCRIKGIWSFLHFLDTFWKRKNPKKILSEREKKIQKTQEDFALFALWTCSLIPNTVQRRSRQEWISHCLPQQGGQDYGEETLLRRVIVALECASASLLRWKVSLFAQLMPGTLLLHPTNDIASTILFLPRCPLIFKKY